MKHTIGHLGEIVIYAIVSLSSAIAIGETLEEWKAIERVKGCNGVPYSTLRGNCRDKQSDVENYCKSSSNPFSCDGLGTKGLLAAIDGIKGEIERLTTAKSEQNNRRSNAKTDSERSEAEDKIREIEDKLYKAQGRLEATKRQVDDKKSEAEKRIYNGQKCRDARRAVQSVFSDVISRAKGESEPELKAIAADKLSNEWEPEYRDHDDHISRVVLPAIEKCNACRSGDR